MSRRLKLAIGLCGVLLVIREFGWLDWSLFQSRSSATSSMSTTDASDAQNLRLAGFDDRASLEETQTVPFGGTKRLTLHYARHVSRPWTRWLPLYKTGETIVQESFSVTSGSDTLLAGKRVQRISLTAIGILSARQYTHLAIDESLKSLRTALEPEIEKAAARRIVSPTLNPTRQ